MIIQFTINSKPFSVNKAYYRNRQLTKDARKWRSTFLLQLQEANIQKSFDEFRNTFDPKIHGIKASYRFCMPKSILFTKQNLISARSCDLTNIEKLVQDNIFDKRFNGREINDILIKNLDIDDKYITELNSRKIVSSVKNQFYIQVRLELVFLSTCEDHWC